MRDRINHSFTRSSKKESRSCENTSKTMMTMVTMTVTVISEELCISTQPAQQQQLTTSNDNSNDRPTAFSPHENASASHRKHSKKQPQKQRTTAREENATPLFTPHQETNSTGFVLFKTEKKPTTRVFLILDVLGALECCVRRIAIGVVVWE